MSTLVKSRRQRLALAFLPLSLIGSPVAAQTDPGVRGGTTGAGNPAPGLTVKEGKFFDAGKSDFVTVASVRGTIANTEAGLGPRFNLDSCAGCHLQPAVGGSSPAVNPQVAMANKQGAVNIKPSFIDANGPIREARFKRKPDGTPDGGVHALFTITGRSDAAGCSITQPDFAAALAQNNVIFRIPTPIFGAGLIESITDSAIVANKTANAAAKASLGISGHENREGNTGTVTRFGWKAQNKSLLIFSGEAYNVELGVTNEAFPHERDETASCYFNPTPEDITHFDETQPQSISSGIVNFTNFARMLAPPAPACGAAPLPACSSSVTLGRTLFTSSTVGCALCHTPTLQTGSASTAALAYKPADLFSDLLVHHMGAGLADDITQGYAGPDEFRTAPLWGVGQRIFFLHDGRTSDLLHAIQAHAGAGSEANGSVAAFNALDTAQKQAILDFLRSL